MNRAFVPVIMILLCCPIAQLQGQTEQPQSPDSLVAHWLERGAVAGWQPRQLLRDCPNLSQWQQRGVTLILAAELTKERRDDLAITWASPLARCRLPWLEQWYIQQVEDAIRTGEHPWGLLAVRTALNGADSPTIRDYFWNLMVDTTKPQEHRNAAGASYFYRFAGEERLREYLRAFETRRMPFDTYVGVTELLLREDAETLMREVGRRVRERPELADQGAFTQIVESSDRHASRSVRRELAEALRVGLRNRPVAGRQRERLDAAAEFLARP